MALTETRPETDEHGAARASSPSATSGAVAAPTGLEGLLGTGDHKTIGRMFMGGGLIGLVGGLVVGVVAVFMANNLDNFEAGSIDYLPQTWSLGRDLVLFGGLVPIIMGLAIYMVPLQIGAPSLAFARGAAASLWTWFLGLDLLVLAYIFNGGPGGARRDFVVLWAAALAMMVGGLVWAMVCVATSILGARTQGMSLERVPVSTWSFFVFSLVGILSLPVLMAELLISFLRIRYFHLVVSESSQLTSVMDGVSIAPAIYWLGIPVLGLAAEMIAVHTGRPINFHKPILVAIGFFGVLTFGADIVGLASVRGIDFNNALLNVGLLTAVLPILAVLAMAGDSIRFGAVKLRAALAGALVSGLLLLASSVVALLGLVEPVMGFLNELAPDSIDMTNSLVLNGTRFHEGIRALMVGATLVAIIGALHHWAPKIWGRRMAEPLGFASILATGGGAVIYAIGEVAAGYDDQPWLPTRATDDFASGLGTISLVGAAVLAAGAAVLCANLAVSFLGSKPVGSSPNMWSGSTLEWATPSPPPVGNFPAAPIVSSSTPLADGEIQYVGMTSDVADGQGSDTEGSSDD